MAGKLFLQIVTFSCIFLFGTIRTVRPSSFYSLPSFTDSGKYGSNSHVVVAEVDKPLDAVLEAVMELGGSIVLLIPQKDYEKRDPSLAPDLGTGRSYSGQRTANVMWGQLASNSPTGPGRRKRNSKDGGGTAAYLSNGEFIRAIRKRGELFPQ